MLCGSALTSTATEPQPAETSYPWEAKAWPQASKLLVDEALDELPAARFAGSAAERRRLDYTRALLLLNAQPKLPSNIDQARTLLESVHQAKGDDELGLDALYYLARIAQFHDEPPDPGRAAALYTELVGLSPEHPLAQAAVAKLATIRLFEDVSPEEQRARRAEFEVAVNRLRVPAARRDLHFVMAEALLLSGDDQPAVLRHLLAAEDAGIVRQQFAADTMVRIAVLARQLGQREVAVSHYKKFLSTFQRDGRAYMLAQQLKSLESEAPLAPVLDSTPSPEPQKSASSPAAQVPASATKPSP